MPDSSLPERIREVLRVRGWSARELSRRAGLSSESHVGLMIGGRSRHPNALSLEKIARAAGVSFEWLATGTGESGLGEVIRDYSTPS